MYSATIETEIGVFGFIGTNNGLSEFYLPGAVELSGRFAPTSESAPIWAANLRRAVQSYAQRDFAAWEDARVHIPIDLAGAPNFRSTDFTRAVWAGIAQIPLGQLWSYQRLAAEIKRPSAVRAVGSACGKNPIPLIVPCHRVVAAQGWGGFSGGTLALKQKLISHECGVRNPPGAML